MTDEELLSGLEAMAVTKRVSVLHQEQYDEGPFLFDGLLDEVIASLVAIRETIPAEYRSCAECQISSVGSYEDSHYSRIEIAYERPETPAETARRQDFIREQNAARLARAQAEYLRLKKMFERPVRAS